MSTNDKELIELILSLDRSEKQYFKRQFSDNNADFILLFDYINKYKEIDTKKIGRYLSKKNGSKALLPKYNSGYISVIKRYLKDKIANCLVEQFITKRQSYAMLAKSIRSDIYLEKGLLDLAEKELEMYNQEKLKGAFPIENLLIYRRQSLLLYYRDYEETTFQDIKRIGEDRRRMAKELNYEIKYAEILTYISYAQQHRIDISQELEEFKKDPDVQGYNEDGGFTSQYMYHFTNGTIADFEGKGEDAIFHFTKVIYYWKLYDDYIQTHPRMYLGVCYAYLRTLQKFTTPEQLILQIEEVEDLLKIAQKANLSSAEKEEFDKHYLMFKCAVFKNQGKYKYIINHASKITRLLESKNHINNATRLLFHYFLAFAYFQERDFENTLVWLDPICVTKEIALTGRADYLSNIALIYLLTHLELGNSQFLLPQLKNKRQMLEKIGRWSVLLKMQFQQIRYLADAIKRNKELDEEDLIHVKNNLEKIENEAKLKAETSFAFSIVEWLERCQEQAVKN